MSSTVLLRPRPYAKRSGSFALVALLPPPKPLPALPSEIWTGIFEFLSAGSEASWSLLTVCKLFKDLALPLVYARVQISKLSSLETFTARLLSAEDGWDSIRRVPWSTPGRWVQTLDLSALICVAQCDALILDSLLVTVFPLIPFLGKLSINSSNRFTLSGRAMDALGQRQGAANLRVLEGISYVPSGLTAEEPLTKLLRCLPNLEELEVIGRELDPTEMDFSAMVISLPHSFIPLQLPCLRTLTIISVYSSSLFHSLLLSPLPALQKLTITPSHDVPYSLSSQFIATHGTSLRSLLLFTPKCWPPRLLPSPHSILCTSLTLRHLSLEKPLPAQLDLPAANTHPLQILSIPRPDAEFWSVLDRLLPRLPSLCMVRARDVRWLRKGMGLRAQEAGVQGEMREWKRRLARRRIRMVDAEWNECQ